MGKEGQLECREGDEHKGYKAGIDFQVHRNLFVLDSCYWNWYMALQKKVEGMSRKKQDIIENTEQPEVTLQDFVIPAKIEAFCEKYKPLSHWREDCDMFTDYQLRTYFKAVVCPLGDPLALYLQELALRGFKMKDDECGEPVIYAALR